MDGRSVDLRTARTVGVTGFLVTWKREIQEL